METVAKHQRAEAETSQTRHTILSCGDIELDVDARLVRIAAKEISVTYVEFEMLHRMLRDPTRVFTRAELVVSVPGASVPTMRAVDIHISRLRKKTSSARSFVIETVPHVGYRCRDDRAREGLIADRR